MTTPAAFAVCALLAAVPAAAEHPHEHPASPPAEAAPAAPAPTPAPAPAPKPLSASELREQYGAAVSAHANAGSTEPFVVRDAKLGKDWKLKLVRVHKDKIVSLGQGRYFACADLAVQRGKDKLDLDFYASRAADGSWVIDEVLVHKVNGKPRFTYDKKNRIVPAKD